MKNTAINLHSHGKMSQIPQFCSEHVHAKNHKNAIVMFSGGLDSTVALWWALDHYENVQILTVDYNQPHVIEVEKATCIANMIRAKHQRIKVGFPTSFWGIENHLTRGQACLMTSLAALNIGHDGADIVMGILATDLYGDCERSFLDSLAGVLYHPNDWRDIGIATPLRALQDKSDVIALGYQYGAPLNLSWTCRDPQNGSPCHACVQCEQRESGFSDFFQKYKLLPDDYHKWSSIFGSPYHPYFQNPSQDLRIVVEAFLQAGAFKRGKKCYVYNAPDGTERVSTHIHTLDLRNARNACGYKNLISAHGYLSNNYRWEVCVCSDGTVAATDLLPDIDTVERALLNQAEI